jgi:U3 small nucleolar RNA-associated protein 22
MFEDFEFVPFRGDHLKPILLVTPKKDSKSKFVSTKFKIKIIPTIEKNESIKNENILEDCFFKDHLVLIHEKMRDCPSLVETTILFKVWLKRRRMYESFDSMNGFLITMLIVYLLNEKIISKNMSSFQMLRNILNWIAKSDQSTISLSFDSKETKKTEGIILKDLNQFNVFSRISIQSWRELKYESFLSLKYLDDFKQNGIESLFLVEHNFFEKYDIHFKVNISTCLKGTSQNCERIEIISKILNLLEKAFIDRILFIRMLNPLKNDELIVGLKLKSNWRLATIRGPSPMEKEKKKEFEEFWGEKSELRKFKDSSIVLSTGEL